MLVGKVSVSKLTIKQLCCFRFILGLKYWNLVITLTLILIDLVAMQEYTSFVFSVALQGSAYTFCKIV